MRKGRGCPAPLLFIHELDRDFDLTFRSARLYLGIGQKGFIATAKVIALFGVPAIKIQALGAHPFDLRAVARDAATRINEAGIFSGGDKIRFDVAIIRQGFFDRHAE